MVIGAVIQEQGQAYMAASIAKISGDRLSLAGMHSSTEYESIRKWAENEIQANRRESVLIFRYQETIIQKI